MIQDLESISLFKELDVLTLHAISTFCEKQALSDGETLISENDSKNYDLYVLLSGRVEIISSSSTNTSGEVSLSKQDKELFGEIAWLSKGARTATVRAIGEVEAIRVDGYMLTEYMTKHPKIGFLLMREIALLLAKRLKSTNMLLKQILWNSHI